MYGANIHTPKECRRRRTPRKICDKKTQNEDNETGIGRHNPNTTTQIRVHPSLSFPFLSVLISKGVRKVIEHRGTQAAQMYVFQTDRVFISGAQVRNDLLRDGACDVVTSEDSASAGGLGRGFGAN